MIETWLETNYHSAFIYLYAHLAAIISPPPPRDWQEH